MGQEQSLSQAALTADSPKTATFVLDGRSSSLEPQELGTAGCHDGADRPYLNSPRNGMSCSWFSWKGFSQRRIDPASSSAFGSPVGLSGRGREPTLHTKTGFLRLRATAWWNWSDSNQQPKCYGSRALRRRTAMAPVLGVERQLWSISIAARRTCRSSPPAGHRYGSYRRTDRRAERCRHCKGSSSADRGGDIRLSPASDRRR